MTNATTLPRVRVQAGSRQVPNLPALAYEPNLLARMVQELERDGLVGENRLTQIAYLVFTSRVMARPLSAVITGPSAAGKSTTTGKVTKLFPESAYYYLTGSSNKAIVYGTASLAHRILIVAEAAGLVREGDGAMMLRSLLSEGRLQ